MALRFALICAKNDFRRCFIAFCERYDPECGSRKVNSASDNLEEFDLELTAPWSSLLGTVDRICDFPSIFTQHKVRIESKRIILVLHIGSQRRIPELLQERAPLGLHRSAAELRDRLKTDLIQATIYAEKELAVSVLLRAGYTSTGEKIGLQ